MTMISVIPLAITGGTSAGSVVLAATLIGFAVWLQNSERRGWAGEQNCSSESTLDRDYLQARARSRRRVNILIGISGVIVLLTTLVHHPIAWMSAWLLVMVCLVIVIGLAGKDVIRTHRYHQKKLDLIRHMTGTGQHES